MATQDFLTCLQPGANADFHPDCQVFTVHSDVISVFLPTGTITLNIPQEIDRVSQLELIKLPDSTCYLLCVFG